MTRTRSRHDLKRVHAAIGSAGPRGGGASVAREVVDAIGALALALKRTQAYPVGHPGLTSAMAAAVSTLERACAVANPFAVGVARSELIVDGHVLTSSSPLVADLARRLHAHHVAALRIDRGATPEEIGRLLNALACDHRAEPGPVGLSSASAERVWPHVTVVPAALDRLALEPAASAPREGGLGPLWRELAASALSGAADAADLATPAALAELLARHGDDPAYGRLVVACLVNLQEASLRESVEQREPVAGEMATLIEALGADGVSRLLSGIDDPALAARLARSSLGVLPKHAARTILTALGADLDHTTPEPALDLLTKLAAATSEEGDESAGLDSLAREAVDEGLARIMGRHPSGDRDLADQGVGPWPRGSRGASALVEVEPERLVALGVEAGLGRARLFAWLDEWVAREGVTPVSDRLDAWTVLGADVGWAWPRLAASPAFIALIESGGEQAASADRVVRRAGAACARVLIDMLAASESRAVRRQVLSWLVDLGPTVAPLAVAALDGAPWYVARNMLYLLVALGEWPDGFDPTPFTRHAHNKVRREAFRLWLLAPGRRRQAIRAMLHDDDDLIVQLGLTAAADQPDADVAAATAHRLRLGVASIESYALALRVLAAHPTDEVKGWLLDQVTVKRLWKRRGALAPVSASLKAVLGALAQGWRGDPEVDPVLEMARKHDDEGVRAAVAGGQRR